MKNGGYWGKLALCRPKQSEMPRLRPLGVDFKSKEKPRFNVFKQIGVPRTRITLDELDDKDGIDELAGVKLLDA